MFYINKILSHSFFHSHKLADPSLPFLVNQQAACCSSTSPAATSRKVRDIRTDECNKLDVISLVGNVLYQQGPISLSFSQPQVRRPLSLPFLVNQQATCCSSTSPNIAQAQNVP